MCFVFCRLFVTELKRVKAEGTKCHTKRGFNLSGFVVYFQQNKKGESRGFCSDDDFITSE
jgi:hypothetical protein